MQNASRIAFNAFATQLAALNGVASASDKFAVAPSIAQRLETRIQESADFLNSINVQTVPEQSGQVIGLGANNSIAGRTDTTSGDRNPSDPIGQTDRTYRCIQTNYDTATRYDVIDLWAKFPDFQARLRDIKTQQIARDRLMIGFNGLKAERTTDRTKNPLLQDVNRGWLQTIREDEPARVLKNIKVGKGGDYENIDALVMDAAGELLAEWHDGNPDIVAICGRQIVNDKYLALVNSGAADAPTEREALRTIMVNRTLGGLPALIPPFMPKRSLLITTTKNLSIYTQDGSYRRQLADEPKRDRIVDYLSMNEAFVVEDLTLAGLLDGILFPDGNGGWA